jgi:hypothetical protein
MTAVYVLVGEPDMDAVAECPDCGFDSLLTFPLTAMSANGVGPWGTIRVCGRCYDGGPDES